MDWLPSEWPLSYHDAFYVDELIFAHSHVWVSIVNFLEYFLLNYQIHPLLINSYYGLAALGPAVRPYLWWKKYITILQIVQFGLLGCHWAYFVAFNEGYSAFFVVNYAVQTILYIILFTRFYLQTYNSSRNSLKSKINSSSVAAELKAE